MACLPTWHCVSLALAGSSDTSRPPVSWLASTSRRFALCLARKPPPVSIDFIATRTGVFADVLQETLLAVYRSRGASGAARVHFISPRLDGSIGTTAAGSFRLPARPAQPWLVPRTRVQTDLLRQVRRSPCRLADYGYTVSTGPLVWNRHRAGLRDEPGRGCYPLVWAESVRPDGVFEFRAEKRNHKPYFRPTEKESWVVTDFPCALVQRTTAKEQCRRLIAAELLRLVHREAWRGGHREPPQHDQALERYAQGVSSRVDGAPEHRCSRSTVPLHQWQCSRLRI